MRPIALAALLAGASLLAQGGFPHGLSLFRLPSKPGQTFRFLMDRELYRSFEFKRGELGLARLMAAGLIVESATAEALRSLDPEAGQDSPRIRWMLVGPGRKVLASGTGQPSLPGLESALRSELGALPWDAIEAVLKARPDHGEARLAMAEWTLALLAPPTGREPAPLWDYGMFRPDRFRWDALDALDALLAIPGWPAQVDLNSPDPGQLGPRLRQQAAWMRPRIRRMAEMALAALRQDPAHPLLQTNLAFLLGLLDRDGAERMMVDLEEVEPLPGQEWLPLPLIRAEAAMLIRAERWHDLKLRSQALSRPVDKLFLSEESWRRRVLRESTLTANACLARNHLEGWEVLPELLDELRGVSGGHYHDHAALILRLGRLPPDEESFKKILQLVARPPLPAPARPLGIPAWRVSAHEAADLAKVREAFDIHPWLCLWLPSERGFLVKRELGWELSLGHDPVAGGQGRLSLGNFPDLMAQGRGGRLLKAWERVGQEPDLKGPRLFRVALLLERGHLKGLESTLAEDLRLTLRGAEILDWPLDENLWYAEAQRALPALEDHLRRWPLDEVRWGALAFWSGFLPRHPGPAQLAEELPSWRPGLTFQLCLPASVHERIGKVLRERRAWSASRAWFEAAWNGLRSLKADHPLRSQLERDVGPVLHAHLDESYEWLEQAGLRRALREAWQDLSGRIEKAPR
jgi:hypothetical protein